ncbi:MAG: hypothetical protein RL441_1714, partial [Actinomycetota bacterium]
MKFGSSRLRSALVIFALCVGLASPGPALAAPLATIKTPRANLAEVERQVNRLQEQAAFAAEQWNEARIALSKVNRRVAALTKKSQRQQDRY